MILTINLKNMLLKNYLDLEMRIDRLKKTVDRRFFHYFSKKTYDNVNESIPKDDFAHQRDHFAYFQAV